MCYKHLFFLSVTRLSLPSLGSVSYCLQIVEKVIMVDHTAVTIDNIPLLDSLPPTLGAKTGVRMATSALPVGRMSVRSRPLWLACGDAWPWRTCTITTTTTTMAGASRHTTQTLTLFYQTSTFPGNWWMAALSMQGYCKNPTTPISHHGGNNPKNVLTPPKLNKKKHTFRPTTPLQVVSGHSATPKTTDVEDVVNFPSVWKAQFPLHVPLHGCTICKDFVNLITPLP